MADRRITLKKIPTLVDNETIDVDLWYNDGSMRRTHRGYWLEARIWKEDGMFRSTDLVGGGKNKLVEPVDRFNAKRLNALAKELKDTRIEIDNLVNDLRAKVGV